MLKALNEVNRRLYNDGPKPQFVTRGTTVSNQQTPQQPLGWDADATRAMRQTQRARRPSRRSVSGTGCEQPAEPPSPPGCTGGPRGSAGRGDESRTRGGRTGAETRSKHQDHGTWGRTRTEPSREHSGSTASQERHWAEPPAGREHGLPNGGARGSGKRENSRHGCLPCRKLSSLDIKSLNTLVPQKYK